MCLVLKVLTPELLSCYTVSKDDRVDIDEKVADADLISTKAVARLSTKAESIHDELDAYGRAHFEKEQAAVQKAFGAVQMLVGAAQVRKSTLIRYSCRTSHRRSSVTAGRG